MKKTLFVCVLALTLGCLSSILKADGIKEYLTKEQLPETSQTFLKTNFSGDIGFIYKETGLFGAEYKVKYVNNTEVKFDGYGVWKKVDCKYAAVPSSIVPIQIASFVKKSYPNALITKIEKDRGGWEIELNIGLEIEFDHDFNVTKIDD